MTQFEELRKEWERTNSEEFAADLISCGVALGRSTEKDVQAAATLLVDQGITHELRNLAKRVLEGKIGIVSPSDPIAFDPELARAQLRYQVVALKVRVREYPKNPVAWVDLARLYTALGQLGKAQEAMRVAVALSPDNRFVLRAASRLFLHGDGRNKEERAEEALHLLRSSRLLGTDPWVMAAEISLSTILHETPQSLKRAKRISETDSLSPWDLAELNGALGTLGVVQGGVGNPRKLFNRSLRAPTENALAQAQWASTKYKIVSINETLFSAQPAPPFEALALMYRAARNWSAAIDACRQWSVMEPTSTRPLVLGSYMAESALEDGKTAREFAERALILSPGEPWVHNNLAVAMALLGDLNAAKELATKHKLHELPKEHHPFYLATLGLIAYRRGDWESGRQLYLEAAHADAADQNLRALTIWHLLREEAKLGAPSVVELADLVWRRTSAINIPELEALREQVIKPKIDMAHRISLTLNKIRGENFGSGNLPQVTGEIQELLDTDKKSGADHK